MQGMARSSFGAHYEVERFGSHLPGKLLRWEFGICYITKTPRIRFGKSLNFNNGAHRRFWLGFGWVPTISVTVFVDDSFSAWWIDANQICMNPRVTQLTTPIVFSRHCFNNNNKSDLTNTWRNLRQVLLFFSGSLPILPESFASKAFYFFPDVLKLHTSVVGSQDASGKWRFSWDPLLQID